MRRSAAALAIVASVAACGGGGRNPEDVVRAWSDALNRNRNDAAADLFAPGAAVVQGGRTIRLATHADAVAWNAALPCNGRIVSLSAEGDVVTAGFILSDSQTSPCDGPGQRVTAVFTVRDGKIVRWEQPQTAPGPTV